MRQRGTNKKEKRQKKKKKNENMERKKKSIPVKTPTTSRPKSIVNFRSYLNFSTVHFLVGLFASRTRLRRSPLALQGCRESKASRPAAKTGSSPYGVALNGFGSYYLWRSVHVTLVTCRR